MIWFELLLDEIAHALPRCGCTNWVEWLELSDDGTPSRLALLSGQVILSVRSEVISSEFLPAESPSALWRLDCCDGAEGFELSDDNDITLHLFSHSV